MLHNCFTTFFRLILHTLLKYRHPYQMGFTRWQSIVPDIHVLVPRANTLRGSFGFSMSYWNTHTAQWILAGFGDMFKIHWREKKNCRHVTRGLCGHTDSPSRAVTEWWRNVVSYQKKYPLCVHTKQNTLSCTTRNDLLICHFGNEGSSSHTIPHPKL